jgi:phage terminase Nu1 subunit (DNA packaging protein)
MTKAVNEKEAAALLGLSVRVLQKWRTSGSPVPYMRLGSSVRYRLDDLEHFMESRLVRSTSEAEALDRKAAAKVGG